MTITELKQKLAEKEELKIKTESIYSQLVGQISLLRDLINQEESSTKSNE
jgi:hypothetical protein